MLTPKDLEIIEQIMLDYPDMDEWSVIKTIASLKLRGLLNEDWQKI